jgi:hypothetical protein
VVSLNFFMETPGQFVAAEGNKGTRWGDCKGSPPPFCKFFGRDALSVWPGEFTAGNPRKSGGTLTIRFVVIT